MHPSHARSALPFLVVLLTGQSPHGSLGFAPSRAFDARAGATRSATALRYKSKDLTSIANEIVDLEGGDVPKSASHDRNPWKALLRSKHLPSSLVEDATSLAAMVRPTPAKQPPTVESLQHDLFSLFQIAQQLTATELELANELASMERERNSIRRLVGRILSLLKERTVGRIQRLLRLDPKQKKDKTTVSTQ
jgi:hypothetical protein